MNLAVGLTLGVGVLLLVSPAMWPSAARSARPSRAWPTMRERLVQAGLASVSVGTLVAVSIILAAATAALVFALVPVGVIAVLAALVAVALPTMAVGWRARARRAAARIVWPDVVDHLVSAVRSGLALPDSVATLAQAGPTATRAAFSDFAADYRSTGNFGAALDRAKAAIADPVADRIIEILRMSREVGGSELTLVLRNLGSYLRQDAAVRLEVEARQSWVLNAARLGVAAPWIVLLLLVARPEAAAAYNSSTGTVVILGGLLVSVIAYRVMLGIGKLPEERRWFR